MSKLAAMESQGGNLWRLGRGKDREKEGPQPKRQHLKALMTMPKEAGKGRKIRATGQKPEEFLKTRTNGDSRGTV